jgi:hypothetical protein
MCPNEVVSTFEFKRNESVENSKYCCNENVYCCNENVYCPLAYQQNELLFASEIISEVFFRQKKRLDFLLKKGSFVNRI